MSTLYNTVPTNFNFNDYALDLQRVDNSKLQHLYSLIGMKSIPVDIYTFMTDSYYLGSYAGKTLRDCWKYSLTKIYPNPITTNSSYIVLRGAIGTGKSFISKIILAYDIYKLCCVEDPFGFFELLGDKMLMIKAFHVTKYRAQELVNEFWEWIYNDKVPFFSDELRNKDSILHKISLSPASTLKDIVGGDVLSVWFSEFNELAPDFASDVLSAAVQRITSRFMKCNNLFSHVLVDSSDKEIGCPIVQFLNKSPYARNALVFSYPKWVATPELFFHAGSFKVYAGDAEINPHILQDGEDTSAFDRDRIITVPDELRDQYESNIELALQETAGVSLAATDRFLDPSMVDKYCTIDMLCDEEIRVDYYDRDDALLDYLQVAIDNLPKDKYIFGGLDLAVKSDLAGLSFGYVDEIKYHNYNGIEVQEAYYRVPIVIGIGRYNGQDTSINKIQDLIMRVHSLHPIKEFVTDQYQSTQLLESLNQVKIPVRRISVDRDDKNMIVFKNSLYSGHVKLPNSTLLKRELKFLKHIGNKVNHPMINPDGTKGSKDCVDSMVRCVISMIDAGVSATDIPSENVQLLTTQYNEIIDKLYDSQVQMRSIYNSMRNM